MYIKDVKSSNGTFINGIRLSPEGVESEPYELKSEDMVVSPLYYSSLIRRNSVSISSARITTPSYTTRCLQRRTAYSDRMMLFSVLGECQVGRSDRTSELTHYQNDPRGPRRPANSMSQGMVNPLSQMGPSVMSAGGKPNGLTFEHVLAKLQNELSRSKETGQELQGLTAVMTEVQDTLGGGLVSHCRDLLTIAAKSKWLCWAVHSCSVPKSIC